MADNQQTVRIVVLNDGETYSDLSGCRILTLTDTGVAKLDEGLEPNDLSATDVSHTLYMD